MDLDIATRHRNIGGFPTLQRSDCAQCPAAHAGFCRLLREPSPSRTAPGCSRQLARAQRNIYVAGQRLDGVAVICDGWAVRYAQLPDGRRQILSVLLPGDAISAAALVKSSLDFSVQALTETRVCHYDRTALRARLAGDPSLFDELAMLFEAEREQADRSLTDLGQRPADERIARFILQIMQRLGARGLTQGLSFAFPLRQYHVADAMGLTAVHVNRVIGQFRRERLLECAGGVMRILDHDALRRVANIR